MKQNISPATAAIIAIVVVAVIALVGYKLFLGGAAKGTSSKSHEDIMREAIVFRVFAQAREAARSISCLSNIKQLSLAVLMYTQDYDEKFPTPLYCPEAGKADACPVSKGKALPWGIWERHHTGWNMLVLP